MVNSLRLEMKEVQSTQIKRIGYLRTEKVLFIDFGRSIYEYLNVPNSLYDELMEAESKGSFFAHRIKSDPTITCIKLPVVLEVKEFSDSL